MKKGLRLVFVAVMLASLTVSQLPSSVQCQMGYGGFLSTNCPMPCCKTKLPMPHCPMLKASAPRDFIASSVPILDSALIPLHDSVQIALPGLRPLSQVLANLAATIQLLIAGPPPSVRAPPADVQLLDA